MPSEQQQQDVIQSPQRRRYQLLLRLILLFFQEHRQVQNRLRNVLPVALDQLLSFCRLEQHAPRVLSIEVYQPVGHQVVEAFSHFHDRQHRPGQDLLFLHEGVQANCIEDQQGILRVTLAYVLLEFAPLGLCSVLCDLYFAAARSSSFLRCSRSSPNYFMMSWVSSSRVSSDKFSMNI